MIIHKITLKNFRQYDGIQSFDLSPDIENDKNIVLIHAENTCGKTALLNAFSWCMYGYTTLPSPERVISNKALAEAEENESITAEIKMDFENDGIQYTLTRSQSYRRISKIKAKASEQTLQLVYRDQDGKSHNPKNPQDYIKLIMPEEMHPYFFFDGEDINKLAMAGSKDKIKTAIRNLMDLTVIDRGVKHLRAVARKFRSDISSFGNPESQSIRIKLEEVEKTVEKSELFLENYEKELKAIQKTRKAIEEQLMTIGPAKALQEERAALETAQKKLNNELQVKTKKIKEIIAGDGALLFLLDSSSLIITDLEEKREKKVLPAGIRDNFINDLLEDGECICGTELKQNTPAFENVKQYLKNKASSSIIEDTANKLSGELYNYSTVINQVKDEINNYITEKQHVLEEIENNNQRISEISILLRNNKELEDIPKLEMKLQSINSQIAEFNRKIGEETNNIKRSQDEIGKLNQDLDNVQGLEEKAELARTRKDISDEAATLLSAINEILIDEVKNKVESRINEVLRSVTGNDIHAEITNDFELHTNEYVGGELSKLDKSTAQNQITSLSFICSLIDIASDNYKKAQKEKKETMLRGGLYPLMMDSPFGSISTAYGPSMIKKIIGLTPQIIVMLSPLQFRNLKQAIYENLAREYVLIRYKENPSDEDLQQSMNIRGQEINFFRKAVLPYTKIEEIN